MDGMVIVREFLYEHEAEMAKGILATEGIDAIVSSDDCGGLRPDIGFASGIRLFVRVKDQEAATQLLSDKFD